jgi:hypothetical protein
MASLKRPCVNINKLIFKNKNAYNIDEIKDKVTSKICLVFPNSKVDHQMQGSITYKILSRLNFQVQYCRMMKS